MKYGVDQNAERKGVQVVNHVFPFLEKESLAFFKKESTMTFQAASNSDHYFSRLCVADYNAEATFLLGYYTSPFLMV